LFSDPIRVNLWINLADSDGGEIVSFD